MSKTVKVNLGEKSTEIELAGYNGFLGDIELPAGFEKLYPWLVLNKVNVAYEKAHYLFSDARIPYFFIESFVASTTSHTPLNVKEKRLSARAPWFLATGAERRDRVKLFVKHLDKPIEIDTTKAAMDLQSITKQPKFPKFNEEEVIQLFDYMQTQYDQHGYSDYPVYLKETMLELMVQKGASSELQDIAAQASINYFGLAGADLDRIKSYLSLATAEEINSQHLGGKLKHYLSSSQEDSTKPEQKDGVSIMSTTFDNIFINIIKDDFQEAYKVLQELRLEKANDREVVDTMMETVKEYVTENARNSVVLKYIEGNRNDIEEAEKEVEQIYYLCQLIEYYYDNRLNGVNSQTVLFEGYVYDSGQTVGQLSKKISKLYVNVTDMQSKAMKIIVRGEYTTGITDQVLEYIRFNKDTEVSRRNMGKVLTSLNEIYSYLNGTEIIELGEDLDGNTVIGVISNGISACTMFLEKFDGMVPIFISGPELLAEYSGTEMLSLIEDMSKHLYVDLERIAPLLSEVVKTKENADVPVSQEEELEYLASIRYLSHISRFMYDQTKIYEAKTISRLLIEEFDKDNDFTIACLMYGDEKNLELEKLDLIVATIKYAQTTAEVGYAPTPDLIRSVISGAALNQDAGKRDYIEIYNYIRFITPRILKAIAGEELKTSEEELESFKGIPVQEEVADDKTIQLGYKKEWSKVEDIPDVEKHLNNKGPNLYEIILTNLTRYKDRSLFLNGRYETIEAVLERNNTPAKLQNYLKLCGQSISYFTDKNPNFLKAIGKESADLSYLETFIPTNYESILVRDFVEEIIMMSEIAYDGTYEVEQAATVVNENSLRSVLIGELLKCGPKDAILISQGKREYARDLAGDNKLYSKMNEAIELASSNLYIEIPPFIEAMGIGKESYLDEKELTKFEKLGVGDFVRSLVDYERSVVEEEEKLIDAIEHLQEAITSHTGVASLMELEVEVHGVFKESLKQLVLDVNIDYSIPTIKSIAYGEVDKIKTKDVVKVFMELEQLDSYLTDKNLPVLIQYRTDTVYSSVEHLVRAHLKDLPFFHKLVVTESQEDECDLVTGIIKTLRYVYSEANANPKPDLITTWIRDSNTGPIDCKYNNEIKFTIEQLEELSTKRYRWLLGSKEDISEKTIEEHLTDMMMAGTLGSYKEMKYGFLEHKTHREFMLMFANAFPTLTEDLPPFVDEFLSGERERFLKYEDKAAVLYYIENIINKQYDSDSTKTLDLILVDEDGEESETKDIVEYFYDNSVYLPHFTMFMQRNGKDWLISKEEMITTLHAALKGIEETIELNALQKYLQHGEVIPVETLSEEELLKLVNAVEAISLHKVNKMDSEIIENIVDGEKVEEYFSKIEVEPKFDIPLHKLRLVEIPHSPYRPVKIEYMRGFYKRVAETLQTLTTYDEMPGQIVKQWGPNSKPVDLEMMSSGEAYLAVQEYASSLNPLSEFKGGTKGIYTIHMIDTLDALKSADKGSVPEFTIQAFKSFGDISKDLKHEDPITQALSIDLGPVYLGEAVAYLFTIAHGTEQYYDSYKEDFKEVVNLLSKYGDDMYGVETSLNEFYQLIKQELPEVASKLITTN